jgi:hypothetical protein
VKIHKLIFSLTLPIITLTHFLNAAAITTIYASENSSDLPGITCSAQLQNHLQAILKIPEAKKLVDEIRKDGSFHIVSNHTALSKQLGAYWDPDRRIIYINFSPEVSDGSMIGSILFEMHNASVNSKIQHLNALASNGKIEKDKYVESMEYLEYINSLNASKITQKGIKMGIFPYDAYLPTYANFKEHFRAQKMSGHSNCFAKNYETCVKCFR